MLKYITEFNSKIFIVFLYISAFSRCWNLQRNNKKSHFQDIFYFKIFNGCWKLPCHKERAKPEGGWVFGVKLYRKKDYSGRKNGRGIKENPFQRSHSDQPMDAWDGIADIEKVQGILNVCFYSFPIETGLHFSTLSIIISAYLQNFTTSILFLLITSLISVI